MTKYSINSFNGIPIQKATGTTGSCYYYYSSGFMLFYGIGSMGDNIESSSQNSNSTWNSYKTSITTSRVEYGITKIGARTFYYTSNLN